MSAVVFTGAGQCCLEQCSPVARTTQGGFDHRHCVVCRCGRCCAGRRGRRTRPALWRPARRSGSPRARSCQGPAGVAQPGQGVLGRLPRPPGEGGRPKRRGGWSACAQRSSAGVEAIAVPKVTHETVESVSHSPYQGGTSCRGALARTSDTGSDPVRTDMVDVCWLGYLWSGGGVLVS
jgi:hypothetical protein